MITFSLVVELNISSLYAYIISIQPVCIMVSHDPYRLQTSLGCLHADAGVLVNNSSLNYISSCPFLFIYFIFESRVELVS
jgi:hypothetical protein